MRSGSERLLHPWRGSSDALTARIHRLNTPVPCVAPSGALLPSPEGSGPPHRFVVPVPRCRLPCDSMSRSLTEPPAPTLGGVTAPMLARRQRSRATSALPGGGVVALGAARRSRHRWRRRRETHCTARAGWKPSRSARIGAGSRAASASIAAWRPLHQPRLDRINCDHARGTAMNRPHARGIPPQLPSPERGA